MKMQIKLDRISFLALIDFLEWLQECPLSDLEIEVGTVYLFKEKEKKE